MNLFEDLRQVDRSDDSLYDSTYQALATAIEEQNIPTSKGMLYLIVFNTKVNGNIFTYPDYTYPEYAEPDRQHTIPGWKHQILTTIMNMQYGDAFTSLGFMLTFAHQTNETSWDLPETEQRKALIQRLADMHQVTIDYDNNRFTLDPEVYKEFGFYCADVNRLRGLEDMKEDDMYTIVDHSHS